MEDEECLPENSNLILYLQNLGFSDLQVTKNAPHNPSGIRFEVSKRKSKLPYVEAIDGSVIDHINIIVSSQLLFEEDVSNVEKLLSNFKVVRNGVMKSMFKDEVGIAVIFLGLGLYWLIGYYAFFIVSSFYAYRAADYFKRYHFHRTRLKKLTSILQTSFILLKKSVKFIEENRLVEAKSTNRYISSEFMEGFNYYKNFKSDFSNMVNEMINMLVKSTQKLINNIPLCDYFENPEYYLCNNISENFENVNVSKLYEIYLLVQSEFLQRLILSLIPNINLSPKNNFCEINKILTETCVTSLKIKKKLNKKFKFIFLNGVHAPKTEFKLTLQKKTPINRYVEDLILNINDTSKTFQNLLLQSRIIEENLISEKIPEFVEQDLVKIQSDLNVCQKNISDSLILFKKANMINLGLDKCDVKIQNDEEEVENSFEGLNKIMIGCTDLDPEVEDEIFEAYCTSENACDAPEIEEWYLEDRLKKKIEKEYCNSVMEELKTKLIEKDRSWKKREKELLRRKGLLKETEEILTDGNKQNSESSNNEKELLDKTEKFNLKISFEPQKDIAESDLSNKNVFLDFKTCNNNESKNEFDSSDVNLIESEFPTNFLNSVMSNSVTNCLNISQKPKENKTTYPRNECPEDNYRSAYAFNKCLLNDLNQAREKIFKSPFPAKEEVFFASDEDESYEENITS